MMRAILRIAMALVSLTAAAGLAQAYGQSFASLGDGVQRIEVEFSPDAPCPVADCLITSSAFRFRSRDGSSYSVARLDDHAFADAFGSTWLLQRAVLDDGLVLWIHQVGTDPAKARSYRYAGAVDVAVSTLGNDIGIFLVFPKNDAELDFSLLQPEVVELGKVKRIVEKTSNGSTTPVGQVLDNSLVTTPLSVIARNGTLFGKPPSSPDLLGEMVKLEYNAWQISLFHALNDVLTQTGCNRGVEPACAAEITFQTTTGQVWMSARRARGIADKWAQYTLPIELSRPYAQWLSFFARRSLGAAAAAGSDAADPRALEQLRALQRLEKSTNAAEPTAPE